MSNANNRGWTCASCLTQRTTEWVETDKLRADLDEAMRQRAHWMEEARRYCKNNEDACAEVERLRAEANARAVEELTVLLGTSELNQRARAAIQVRIAELSKPAAKESKQQHGQESTATAAPSRSPQGESVEVPPRGQEQGASGPRGIGQPAHPPGARGGESGIVAESQGHRPGEAVSDPDGIRKALSKASRRVAAQQEVIDALLTKQGGLRHKIKSLQSYISKLKAEHEAGTSHQAALQPSDRRMRGSDEAGLDDAAEARGGDRGDAARAGDPAPLQGIDGGGSAEARRAVQGEVSRPAQATGPVSGTEVRGQVEPEKDALRCTERVWASGDMEACDKPLPCSDHTKPKEEPDWTVTLAAQAKNAYALSDEPADESAAKLLALVVQGLCNLGREVRRGGKS